MFGLPPRCPRYPRVNITEAGSGGGMSNSNNGAVFPGLTAASKSGITKLAEAGNLTCSKDNPPNSRDLDHIILGKNWLPNITMSAYLAGRYKLMDDWLSSSWDH